MFGEGRHPDIKEIYETHLAPFLTQATSNFWGPRLWYFEKGLYYQGGQVYIPLHHIRSCSAGSAPT